MEVELSGELISSPCCVVVVVEYTTGIIDDDDERHTTTSVSSQPSKLTQNERNNEPFYCRKRFYRGWSTFQTCFDEI